MKCLLYVLFQFGMKIKEEPISPKSSPESKSRKRSKITGHKSKSSKHRSHERSGSRSRHESHSRGSRDQPLHKKIKKEELSDGEIEETMRSRWGPSEPTPVDVKKEEKPKIKEKPNLGLSGALTKETNMYRGVLINYSEPPEAKVPKKRWRVYPFKVRIVSPLTNRFSC